MQCYVIPASGLLHQDYLLYIVVSFPVPFMYRNETSYVIMYKLSLLCTSKLSTTFYVDCIH